MTSWKKLFLSIALGFLYTSPLYAYNTSFLSYSAIYYFNSQDTQLMKAAIQQGLNSTKDGVKVSWRNPHSTAFGYVIPSNTSNKNGVTCRDLKLFNSARKVTGESQFRYCKLNGVWKVVS